MRSLGVLLLVIGGCSFEGKASPDAMTEPDGPPQSRGMFLTWDANPALPGPLSDKITVTDVSFQIEHLQLVSDAGAPMRSRYELEWKTGQSPDQESFPDAPVAVYQQITLNLRPDVQPPYSYQIVGVWHDSGDDFPFRIADSSFMGLDVMIDCSESLPPGGSVSIGVRLDLRDALGSVDFKSLQEFQGVLVMPPGPMLNDFRSRLSRAFSIDD